MSLIIRAQVAAAAHDVVQGWPLESFIAVNPLAGHEPRPFESAAIPGVMLTRSRAAYLSDYALGRITSDDLEAALLERIPELAAELNIGKETLTAARLAALDMASAEWESITTQAGASPWLDDYIATWVSSYLNPQPLWPMPHKQHGFYRAWRILARQDPALSRSARRRLVELPAEPDAALAWALEQLGVPTEATTEALRHELAMLPGWVGHIKWRADKLGDIDLISYLAVRCAVRVLQGMPATTSSGGPPITDSLAGVHARAGRVAKLLHQSPNAEDAAVIARVLASHPVGEHRFTWQKAYELHYRASLLPALSVTAPDPARPHVQVVMCIDPRSEGMRRHLEETANLETFGFAGFFGIPVRFARYGARGAINSLPALLTPRHSITEHSTAPALAQKVVSRRRTRDALRQAIHRADSGTATPFALAEATGLLYGATSILRTFAPSLHARLHRSLSPSPITPDSTVTIADTFTLPERAALAETAVRMMGMAEFAPLVVLAGHASESTNNLYESALECGACGGNPGSANARSAAAIFNDPDVRALLTTRGIDIPTDTFFVAAEHNTVSDVVTLLDRHLIPLSHAEISQQFDHLQGAAADRLVRERAADLPGAAPQRSVSRMRRRAYDWAEVYPELGLAGNAAMIIGPRDLTRDIDLARRVFLHSYETRLDPDGTALESIMTAPLVVAQWINHQYYFSAINPTTLGAGTKTIHNAIGAMGVLAGHGGDLRRGLPWQSVGFGSQLLHEPMRLTVVVQAPLERVGGIISRNQVLRNLLDNDWITLTARNEPTAAWHRYTHYGWTPAPATKEGRQL